MQMTIIVYMKNVNHLPVAIDYISTAHTLYKNRFE